MTLPPHQGDTPRPSVVVRTKDSAATVEATLDALRSQTVDVEVVVVDSGSTDGTLAIAERRCDRLARVESAAYTPGRALNRGTEAATGEIVFALSSHCAPQREDWVERALSHYSDAEVAAVAGTLTTPEGETLTEAMIQTSAEGRRYPLWGFSNHASSWRRSVWAKEPFDETLPAVEDKEWAWRILDNGWTIAYDPALWIEQSHRWRAGAIAYFRRERTEHRVLGDLTGAPPMTLSDLAQKWWRAHDDGHGRLLQLLNYRRTAGLLGRYAGERDARS